jgi:glycerophosphoryl diester phosphodiesterase
VLRCSAALIALVAGVALAPPAAANPWLDLKVMNIAHQGGEDEAPSNTMYAYERAVGIGSDMLEVDIHSTADGHVVVMHDGRVDRTTQGTGSVYDMTLAEVQALDAAHDFVPGEGTKTGAPESAYVFRGVRTGAKPPPAGFGPDDFRIPTLAEVLLAYPNIPVNIEIKGAADSDVDSFLRNAELLAQDLNRLGRSAGVIVASFNDAALVRFHELAPDVGLAPATGAVAAFKLANVAPPEGTVAFQVPITFAGVGVTDAEFVQRAHAQGYAVHVWLSGQREAPDVYEQLLDWNVDGIMAAEPASLERVLCDRGVARPPTPGVTHCPAAAVNDCDARPVRVSRVGPGGRFRLRLARERPVGRCTGAVRVRGLLQRPVEARRRAVATARFTIRDGRAAGFARLRLTRRARRNLARRLGLSVRAIVQPAAGEVASRRFSLVAGPGGPGRRSPR